LTDAYQKGIFSGIVIISHEGKEIYFKQLGFADWQTKRALNKNTLFNIGSLNKQFTKEIIHQLIKEGKLSYDDTLSKYLDFSPIGAGNRITIQQLLDMKAGLGDYLQYHKFD
jgi:CubicO group peptidase (beta-lactamase class C family)